MTAGESVDLAEQFASRNCTDFLKHIRVQNTFISFAEEEEEGNGGGRTLARQKSDDTFDRLSGALCRKEERVQASSRLARRPSTKFCVGMERGVQSAVAGTVTVDALPTMSLCPEAAAGDKLPGVPTMTSLPAWTDSSSEASEASFSRSESEGGGDGDGACVADLDARDASDAGGAVGLNSAVLGDVGGTDQTGVAEGPGITGDMGGSEQTIAGERLPPSRRLDLVEIRDGALAGHGLGGMITTVMVKHVPRRYSQKMLLREMDGAGFEGRYDYFYLPVEPRNLANKGFAFLNFDGPETSEWFYRVFHGKFLKHFHCNTPLAVLPADVQGFEQNAEVSFAERTRRRRPVGQTCTPLFLKPLPTHLAAQQCAHEEQQPCSSPAAKLLLQHIQLLAQPEWPPMAGVHPAYTMPSLLLQQQALGTLCESQGDTLGEAPGGLHTGVSTVHTGDLDGMHCGDLMGSCDAVPGGATCGGNTVLAKFCTQCGEPVCSSHKFCGACGVQISLCH